MMNENNAMMLVKIEVTWPVAIVCCKTMQQTCTFWR